MSSTGLGILDDHRTASARPSARERSGQDACTARRAREIRKHRQNDGLERGTLSARLRLPGHTPDVRVTLADSAPPTITFMLDICRTACSSTTTGRCARGCGRGEPARMHAATLNANILPRRPRMMQPARLVSPCTRAPTPRAREMRVATLSALVGGRPGRARCRDASYTVWSQQRARASTRPSDDGPSTDWIGRAAGMARRPAGGRRSSARDSAKKGRG